MFGSVIAALTALVRCTEALLVHHETEHGKFWVLVFNSLTDFGTMYGGIALTSDYSLVWFVIEDLTSCVTEND